jgi:hypothetical protein
MPLRFLEAKREMSNPLMSVAQKVTFVSQRMTSLAQKVVFIFRSDHRNSEDEVCNSEDEPLHSSVGDVF